MDFFSRLDSESDHESEYLDQADKDPESQIHPDWFAVTDDDEDEEEHRIFGKDKANAQIQVAIDTYDYSLSEQSWTDALEQLNDLLSRVENYKRKYQMTPQTVVEYIREHTDLAEELEGKTKKDFASPRDFASLKQLHAAIDELKESYAKAEQELLDAEAALDKDEEEVLDDSEAGLARRLVDIIQGRYSAIRLRRHAIKCSKLGYTALHITALARFVVAVLEEEQRFPVPKEKWEEALQAADECVSLLQANNSLNLSEDLSRVTSSNGRIPVVTDGLAGMLETLQISLLRSSQNTKCSDTKYLWIPTAEQKLATLTDRVVTYYGIGKRPTRRHVMRCCKILLSLIGYRTPAAQEMLFEASESSAIMSESIMETIKNIFRVVATSATREEEDMRMTAVCYIGYQYGLAGQFRKGRDVLLRAGVPAYVTDESCPIALSILYNRVIARLGLTAFVNSEVAESYALLGTLWEQYSPAVLIGQTITQSDDLVKDNRMRDQTVQQHYAIPYQHLELAAMLSALIIDTVNEAKKPFERSRVQKFFYRAISRPPQLLCANSSLIKDQIYAAHKALKVGDYLGAKRVVENMQAWRTLTNGDEVLARYLEVLKDTALRVFCFSYRSSFATFSVEQLSTKYDMDAQKVRNIINDMIWDGDSLVAHWDRDDSFLYVDRSNPTRLQHIVIGAADSVVELAPFKDPRSRANEGRGRGGAGGRGAGGRGAGGRGRGRGRGN